MKYSSIRNDIKTGDIALIAGSGLLSLLIRIFSAGSYSHVAIFFWDNDDLFVSEVREFDGHRITHASVWIDEQLTSGKHVKVGVAPSRVRGKSFVAEFVQEHRAKIKRYAWYLLPIVWLSHVVGFDVGDSGFVCSKYVQAAWRHAGRALLPSDFARLCESTHTITEVSV